MKKSFLTPAKFFIALALAFIAGGAYYFYLMPQKSDADPQILFQQYQILNDSLDQLNLRLQEDTAAEKQKLFLDQIKFLQTQIEAIRSDIQQIPKAESSSTSTSADPLANEWVEPWVLWLSVGIVGLILLLSIVLLILKIRKSPPPPKPSIKNDPLMAAYEFRRPTIRPKDIKAKPSIPTPPPVQLAEDEEVYRPIPPLQTPPPAPVFTAPETEDRFEWSQPTATHPPEPTSAAEPNPEIWQDSAEQTRQDVIKLARRGFTSSEIARRLKLSQDKVEFILKVHRQKGI